MNQHPTRREALQTGSALVAALLAQGEKILAIRLYRELHGGGLKEAKEAVEAMGRENSPPDGE